MAGPIQVFSNPSNLTTFKDLARYVGAFAGQVQDRFNGLVAEFSAERALTGFVTAIGGQGVTTTAYAVTLLSTGQYRVFFTNAFSSVSGAVLTGSTLGFFVYSGVTNTQADIFTYGSGGAAANIAFSFAITGVR